jgi:hypothetical protein
MDEKDCIEELENSIGYYDMPEAEDTIPVNGKYLCEAIDDLKEHRAIFAKTWERHMEAIKFAQENGFCDELTWPDQGDLMTYLLDEYKKQKESMVQAATERDTLAKALEVAVDALNMAHTNIWAESLAMGLKPPQCYKVIEKALSEIERIIATCAYPKTI